MKISVLTPSFNCVKYIRRAIESVLKQEYSDWEHVIMDGGSNDGTINILEEYSHLIWESSPDKGQSDAMNKAFKKSTGELVIYLNADDELADGLFVRMVAEFEKNPIVDMVVGNLITQNNQSTSVSVPSVSLGDAINFAEFKFPLNPVSYMYRRKLQKRIGDFPVDNHYVMDYWFLLRAYLYGAVHKINFECGTFYFDGSNKSADFERALAHLSLVRTDFLKRHIFYPKVFFSLLKSKLHSSIHLKTAILKLGRYLRNGR